MVHFSTSEDTVCTMPLEGDYDSVYYWQAPDYMTDSLFIDFWTEIVDSISDRDRKRFLELLEPSATLRNELLRLNQKREKWFRITDDETSLRIREVCSNFCTTGDYISLYPPQRSIGITSIDVLVNSETDPSGELRRIINRISAADSALYEELEAAEEAEESQDVCVEDEYPSDEEEEINEEVQANPEKPCYYPSQIEMAAILKKRIDTIMWYYHNIAKLSDVFDDVEFAVYTARYRMLSDQTEKRICHPDAGVLSREELEARENWNVKKRMFMYVRSAETDTHFEQLKQDVQQKPKTLFIIIADECHWGITKDKDQKPSAHNLFINEWCKENSPRNVVVVQISATPFNLLTQNSRLPEVRCILLYDSISTTQKEYRAGDLLVLYQEPDLDDQVREICKTVELHVVHWSEVELKNFERGMRMKLRSTLIMKDASCRYLHVSPHGELDVTSSGRDATEFIIQGRHGIVTIKAVISEERILTVTGDANGRLKAKVEPLQPATFEVKLDFGIGVAAFSWCEKGDHYLAVNEYDHVTLEAAKVDRKCGVSIMKPKQNVARVSFEFYIDRSGPAEVNLVGKQYLSLNYYLSTMNCFHKEDQKIRDDEFFQRIVDKAKREKKLCKSDSSSFKIDALLCAEYCYYVLHVSAYDSDNRIREALTTESETSPAAQFDRRLDSFVRQLKRDKKYIQPEAFCLVRREICDRMKQEFKKILKEFSKKSKHQMSKETDEELKNLGEVLAASFVGCLMHLSQQDLQEVLQDKRETAIIEDIKQTLQEDDCGKMVEIWNRIVHEYETSSLVKNLIESGKQESGKMKIVRAKSMEAADQFFHTLRLARGMSSLEECFEIIRDYGGIQIEKQLMKSSSPFFIKLQPDNCQYKFDCCCSELKLQRGRKKCVNCQHVHKSVTQYEDLENLACVLILVDKGRMGDTFPQSFDCLDLRLNYDSSREFKEGSPLFLSTVIQELGRMCRYAKPAVGGSSLQNIPHVLVGRELYKRLRESVEKSPSVSAISCTRADRYMTTSRRSKGTTSSSLRWLDYEAHKDSYDHENHQTHCNRILLQAEPQIGKTGTYLCLIRLLRLDILGKEKVSSTAAIAFDEGTFYLHKQCDFSEELTIDEISERQNWQLPYWKTIHYSPSLYDKTVVPGKYSIGGRFYTHDTEENPFILFEREDPKPTKSAHHYQKIDCADGMRAWHWYHFENCAECGRHLQSQEPVLENTEVEFDGKLINVKCSLPPSCLYDIHVRKRLHSGRSSQEGWTKINLATTVNNTSNLPYWIFHPSHRNDPRKCLLNYNHVMQEQDRLVSYVQIAVVRSEKFQAYSSTWGKVLAIFQLPDELPSCEIGPNEGGVGYARLFIQKIAFALNLEYVFVIDDNVAVMSEAVFRSGDQPTSDDVLRDEDGAMKMDRCSFSKPLSHLLKIAEGKDIPTSWENQFEPYPFKNQHEAQQFPQYSYTGPAKLFGDKQHESYGVLGLLRSVPTTVRPFAKTQVYAAVLLNVKSTVEKNVFYRPWPCWEDLRFNDDCDKAGLWVVKCNRYRFLKVQYNDWINNLALPCIFQWNEESTLEERPLASELPEDLEESIILEHLRNLIKIEGPEKCYKGQIGYDQPGDGRDKLAPTKIVEKLEANEGTEDTFPNEIPVLISSYCASNRTSKNMILLNSRFCATKEKIVFITSASDAMERWPRLSLATIPTHSGICFFSEMSDRNAQFSILSAADPKRHRLRWILIAASFLHLEDNKQEEITTIPPTEEMVSEHNLVFAKMKETVDENTSSDYPQHTRNDENGTTSSLGLNRSVQGSLTVTQSPQVSSVAERPLEELSSEVKSLIETTSAKKYLQQSPGVKRTLQDPCDSPSKRRKIEDCFRHQEDRMTRDENNNERTSKEKWVSDNVKDETVEGRSRAGCELPRKKKKAKKNITSIENRDNCKSKERRKGDIKTHGTTSDSEQPKVSKKLKTKLKVKTDGRSTSPVHSSQGEEMLWKNVGKKQKASTSQAENDNIYEAVGDSTDSGNSTANSVYTIQDDEVEWTDAPEMYTALNYPDAVGNAESDNESNANSQSSRIAENSRKISPSNSAYLSGTSNVTKIIVDLWREYRRMRRNNEGDLTMKQVKENLDRFPPEELQMADNQGYTALLKACSLPSISPHVIQYLIGKRKVDLNCKLPYHFDGNHGAAKGLTPGMSALSVAIRRSNTTCISTFMRRQTEIDVRSADQEGNTALHHSVLMISKGAFQKLFALYKPLKWKEMLNSQGKSPLDLGWNLVRDSTAEKRSQTKKQALEYILEEMEETDLSIILR